MKAKHPARRVKPSDIVGIAISALALLVSVATFAWQEVKSKLADSRQERKLIYEGSQIGIVSTALYAYYRSTPSPDAEQKRQIDYWTVEAKGLCRDFGVSDSEYDAFKAALSHATASEFRVAMTAFSPNIERESSRAAAAYDLGWKSMVFGLSMAEEKLKLSTDESLVPTYGDVRGPLEADLQTLQMEYHLPAAVSSAAEFERAMQDIQAALRKLKP